MARATESARRDEASSIGGGTFSSNGHWQAEFPNVCAHSAELKSGIWSGLVATVANQSSKTTWQPVVMAPVEGLSTSGTKLAWCGDKPTLVTHWEHGFHFGIFFPSAMVWLRRQVGLPQT